MSAIPVKADETVIAVRELAALEATAERSSGSTASQLAADALERLKAADIPGAADAIKEALKLQPLDPHIRALYRQVDELQREAFYKEQHWDDLCAAAKAANQEGDIEAALALVSDSAHSPSSARQAEAQELYEQLRREVLLVEFAITTVRKRMAEGNVESARAICRSNLLRYPYHKELRWLAEELGLPVPAARSSNSGVRVRPVPEPRSALSVATDEQLATARAQHSKAQTRLASAARTCPDPVDETSAIRNFDILTLIAKSTPRVQTLTSAAKFAEELSRSYPDELAPQSEELSNAAYALADAREQLRAGRPNDALAACERYELCFPEYYGFKYLRAEIEIAEAFAATEYLEKTFERLERERDENRCSEILNEALSKYPGEPFYLHALDLLGGKRQPERQGAANWTAPELTEVAIREKLSRAMIVPEEPQTTAPSKPSGPKPKTLWMIAAGCGAIALIVLAVALFGTRREQVAERSAPALPAPSVAVSGNLPMHVYSPFPVQVSVDEQRTEGSGSGASHDLILPAGEHLVLVSNPSGSASFLITSGNDHPTAQFYAAGLSVAVLVNHHLSVSGPSLKPISLDGRPLGDSSSADITVPDLATGRHELRTGDRVLSFDLRAGEQQSIYAFIGPSADTSVLPTKTMQLAPPPPTRVAQASPATSTPAKNVNSAKPPMSAEQRHLEFQPKAVQLKAAPLQMSAPPSDPFYAAESPLPAALVAEPPPQLKPPPRPANTDAHDREEILARLHEYTEAWRSRDIRRILAARPGVARQSVETALDGVVLLSMIVRPIAPPSIQGEHARVDCFREISQTYVGGRATRASNSRVVYYFAKQNGRWVIEGLR